MKNKKQITIIFLFVLIFVTAFCTSCDKITAGDSSNQGGTETGGNQQTDQGGNAERHKFTIAVMSDIHLLSSSEIEDDDCASLVEYTQTKQRMLAESELLFKSAVDQVIEDKVDVVLLGGDLVECGSRTSLEVVASECARMKQAGINVHATCGVSDLQNQGTTFTNAGSVHTPGASKKVFAEIFADYGYGSALMRDTGTLSYCIDIPNSNYRLVVVDTASNFDHSDYGTQERLLEVVDKIPKASDELLDFTESMLISCEEEGKEPLCLSYYPICDDIGEYIGSMTKALVISIDRGDEFEDILSEYGTKYIFSGHLHTQNYLEKENFFGSIVNQATGCLSCYPLPINYFTLEEDGSLTYIEKGLQKVNPDYFPDYLSEEKRTAMLSDLLGYARNFVYENLKTKWQASIDWWEGLENGLFLKLFYSACLWNYPGVDNSIAEGIAADLVQGYHYTMNLPLYGETDSLESICKEYDVILPKTEYTTVFDFLASQICDIYSDDIHLVGGSDEAILIRYITYYIAIQIADLDIFNRFHQVNALVDEYDLHGIAEHLFRTGVIDLTIDDSLLHIMSFVNPKLQEIADMKLDFESVDAVLEIVETLYPAVLSIISEEYNPETGVIWGIKLTDYINVRKGTINFTKFIDFVLLDLLAKDFLY